MYPNPISIDFEAVILALLLTEYASNGDKNGHPATPESYMVSDLEISGDDFYEFIESIETELDVKFPDEVFTEICNLVPSEGELLSLLWWKSSRRDISVRELSIYIKTKLKELRDGRLSSKPQTRPPHTSP